ncbi:hypothetical protein AB0N28_03720 [Streptomyces sp. NPDC051130]|uniref:hypothetical protein n=1 Tax=Streptomyces sp. NPDC051130 TaxID=3157223 RepID=UPI003435008D
MPGVDDLDQNVPYPLLSDPPNIESAVGNLVNVAVPKLNMTFADANARAAAIPSPTPGMECFLIAEQRKEIYDGSTWVTITPTGWVPITFSSGYEARGGSPAYRIVNQCVELRGSARRVGGGAFTRGAAFVIANLPSIARPPAYRTYIAATEWAADLYARVEVEPGGNIVVIVAPTSTTTPASWVCFDGIRYSLV